MQAERSIDPGAEWRNFADSGKDRSRAQETDDFLEGLSTGISNEVYQGKPGEQLDKETKLMSTRHSRIAVSRLSIRNLLALL